MITTIIFDIGNVLVDFCWEEYLDSFHFEPDIREKVARATVLSDAWNEFDRGGSEEEELIVSVKSKNGKTIAKDHFTVDVYYSPYGAVYR